jgi:hypothetical protein
MMTMERRNQPRSSADLPVEIVLNNRTKMQLSILDISYRVLKVCCNRDQMEMLTPRGICMQNGRPIELDIRRMLPDNKGGSTELRAHCQIVFCRRVAFDTYHIGMQYAISDEARCAFFNRCQSTWIA